MSKNQQAQNTDRLLWREQPDDPFSDAIYVTQHGNITINCGGYAYCLPVRSWHRLGQIAGSVAIELWRKNSESESPK